MSLSKANIEHRRLNSAPIELASHRQSDDSILNTYVLTDVHCSAYHLRIGPVQTILHRRTDKISAFKRQYLENKFLLRFLICGFFFLISRSPSGRIGEHFYVSRKNNVITLAVNRRIITPETIGKSRLHFYCKFNNISYF